MAAEELTTRVLNAKPAQPEVSDLLPPIMDSRVCALLCASPPTSSYFSRWGMLGPGANYPQVVVGGPRALTLPAAGLRTQQSEGRKRL